MHCIIRRLASFAVIVFFMASCSGQYSTHTSDKSLASGGPQKLRYRVTDVVDQTRPGIEWQLDPPLSPQHDAVQVLFWAGSGHFKICKGGDGRFIRVTKSFLTPRPLKDTVFELRVDHIDGDTIITLAFLKNGTFESAASLRIPGIHMLSGPSDQYLCEIEQI
jgi:hypothetical protein